MKLTDNDRNYIMKHNLTIGRAYAISYFLMLPLIIAFGIEFAGTLGDGSTSSSNFIGPLIGNLIASFQLSLIVYIWMMVIQTRTQHRHHYLRVMVHCLYTIPFLLSAIRLVMGIIAGFISPPHTVALVVVVVANVILWKWLKKQRPRENGARTSQ